MDRTVYYNTESCSTISDDSYQNSIVTSSRIRTPRENKSPNNGIRSASKSSIPQYNNPKEHQHVVNSFPDDMSSSKSKPKQGYHSIPKCHTAGAGARHIFHKKTGVSGGGLTRSILHSGISRVAIPCNKDRDEMEFQYGTVLVLHLQCKNIFTMTPGALDAFVNLKNLYLYKNNIRRIQGLDLLRNLELLDLSRNNVERIDNLEKCNKLKKLYLGFNEIQIVEGLEGLVNLEELHIDDQDMPPEQPIIFSPGIMASVSHSLVVLDLSSNQLKSLEPIAELTVLHTLFLADNKFSNFENVIGTLETLRQLRVLTLKGNPIASKPNYKSKIIGAVLRLEVLDDKDINDTTRACVQKLRLIKEFRARQREETAMLNKMKQEAEEQSYQNSHHVDLGHQSDFNFSTPTRLSPLPPPKARSARTKLPLPYGLQSKASSSPEVSDSEESHSVGNAVIDSSSYDSRARNSADDDFLMDVVGGDEDQMSDMAKIIFRLSNLDDIGPGGDGGNKVKMQHANYWEFPGTSLARECRPLSPLDGEQHAGMPSPSTGPTQSTSVPEILGQTDKKSSSGHRPKPAAPGGRRCSNNVSKSIGGPIKSSSASTVSAVTGNQFQGQRHFYGRTLSPLMELPTPESLTARDEHN